MSFIVKNAVWNHKLHWLCVSLSLKLELSFAFMVSTLLNIMVSHFVEYPTFKEKPFLVIRFRCPGQTPDRSDAMILSLEEKGRTREEEEASIHFVKFGG